jgi:predicted Zn-dependent protease
MLWRLDRRVSARRELDAAAALAPGDPVVLTADAVSHFTKKDPTAAFARLGPLTGRFPQAAVVRLHLGVLLLWTRQIRKGIEQLRLAAAEHPRSIYAREARSLLEKLVRNGTR